jgi:hypothetical protein
MLSEVYRPHDGSGPQWRVVSGLEGVFIANRAIIDRGQDLDSVERRFDAQARDYLADRDGDAAADNLAAEGEGAEVEVGGKATDLASKLLIRTYVSVDSGAVWQALPAPASALAADQVLKDKEARALHLKEWISSAAAPGVVLGVGNIGIRLSEDPDHHSVFLSRDAGLSWKKVIEGPHQIAMLSHGDAIVAASEREPGTVKYSADNGKSWSTVSLHSMWPVRGIALDSLYMHPSHTTWRLFLAMRSDEVKGARLFSLDFAGILKADCKLAEKPSDPASDFERWSPADALEDAHSSKRSVCFFGVRTNYVRRRPDHLCKTGALRLSPNNLRMDTACQCEMSDYACDVGFYRASYEREAPCVPLESSFRPNVTGLCGATTSEYVQVTQGYVKIPGNRCNGGRDLSPKSELCITNTGLAAALRRNIAGAIAGHIFQLRFVTFASLVALAIMLLRGGGRDQGKGGMPSCELSFFPCMPGSLYYGNAKRPWRREASDNEDECEFLINGNNI